LPLARACILHPSPTQKSHFLITPRTCPLIGCCFFFVCVFSFFFCRLCLLFFSLQYGLALSASHCFLRSIPVPLWNPRRSIFLLSLSWQGASLIFFFLEARSLRRVDSFRPCLFSFTQWWQKDSFPPLFGGSPPPPYYPITAPSRWLLLRHGQHFPPRVLSAFIAVI